MKNYNKNKCSWGVITTLKGSVEQTLDFVNYHLNSGADCIMLYFDDPNDPAINKLSSNERVICTKCTMEHWKKLSLLNPDLDKKILGNMEHAVPILREKRIDWAICIDSDELLYLLDKNGVSNEFISDILSKQNEDIGSISVKSYESVVTKDQYSNRAFCSKWFKVQPKNYSFFEILPYKIFNNNIKSVTNEGFFFGHREGKSFFRTNLTFSKTCHHFPRFTAQNINYIQLDKLALLHFDCIMYENWRRRWSWRVTGETNSICMGPQRLKQFSIISNTINNKSEESLYKLYNKWFYKSPIRLFFLKLFGQIVYIDIKSEKFKNLYDI
jgi:hypothetical protein